MLKGKIIKQPIQLRYFTFSRAVLVGGVVLFVLPLLGIDFGNFEVLLLNLRMLALFFIIVQGVGVISYFLNKRGVKGILFTIIIGLFIAMPILNFALVLIGVLDLIMDFRKLRGVR